MAQTLRIFALVIFALFLASAAEARQVSGFVESWNVVSDSGTTPEINVYAHGPAKGSFGWTAWTLTTEEWSEALAGLSYAPAKWMEVSFSLGLEGNDMPLRQGASVWVGKGRWSFIQLQENGGSGWWYRSLGTFQATKSVAVGFNSQSYLGTGPYIEKSFGRILLFGVYAVDTKKSLLSARLKF